MKARDLRRTVEDADSRLYELELGCWDSFEALVGMYDAFLPKKAAQGLPPDDGPARRNWVRCLMEKGENFLIWKDSQVVGHASLLPDFVKKDAEYMIFMNQDYRGRGLGTALTDFAMCRARELDLKNIWLTVDGHNYRAIGLYKKFGFGFCDDGGWERFMSLKLA